MINLYGSHSPIFYIISFGSLGIFCSYKAWRGFTDTDKTDSTILLSQSYLIFAIGSFSYFLSMYLYQSNLVPSLQQNNFFTIGNIWFVIIFLTGGLHGFINRKIINQPWHRWVSLQLLILGGIFGIGEILMIFFPLK